MSTRKRSPNAPAFSLREAIEKVLPVFDKEKLHPVQADVMASDLGYSNAKTGSSARALSTLKSFGLIHSPSRGMLAVTSEVRDYKFTPDAQHRDQLLQKWVRGPKQFEKLITRYPSGTPSDAALTYDLIQEGFAESSAKQVVRDFLDSVEFAGIYDSDSVDQSTNSNEPDTSRAYNDMYQRQTSPLADQSDDTSHFGGTSKGMVSSSDEQVDRIPVRLPGGRRAWLEIPTPFYESDKTIIQNQIELIVTDEQTDK